MTKTEKTITMVKLSSNEIDELKTMLKEVRNALEGHKGLEEKLKLKNKLNGVIGEAIGLAKLFEAFGNDALYQWHGKFKRDYDIIIKKNGISKKFQIKTSANERFVFRVAKIGVENKEVKERIIQDTMRTPPMFGKMFDIIDHDIREKDVDIWLLIHIKDVGEDVYALTKDELIKLVKRHYQDAIENRVEKEKIGKKLREFNGYIGKEFKFNPILQQKRKTDVNLLEPFKNKDIKLSS